MGQSKESFEEKLSCLHSELRDQSRAIAGEDQTLEVFQRLFVSLRWWRSFGKNVLVSIQKLFVIDTTNFVKGFKLFYTGTYFLILSNFFYLQDNIIYLDKIEIMSFINTHLIKITKFNCLLVVRAKLGLKLEWLQNLKIRCWNS